MREVANNMNNLLNDYNHSNIPHFGMKKKKQKKGKSGVRKWKKNINRQDVNEMYMGILCRKKEWRET